MCLFHCYTYAALLSFDEDQHLVLLVVVPFTSAMNPVFYVVVVMYPHFIDIQNLFKKLEQNTKYIDII